MNNRKPNTAELLPLDDYDVVIVSFSGGKDSLACLLHLLDIGCPKEKIELWHQCVDGAPNSDDALMDWPVTEGYVKAVGESFNVPVRFQWKVGGFRREMLRHDQSTETVGCELRDGTTAELKHGRSKPSTRRMFPQVSADLSVRWCSAYLKIDVCSRAITNDPSLKAARILVVTGERAEESAARAKYAIVEKHRCNSKKRIVHQWRPVADWTEQQVWDIMKRHGVVPHPAYRIGFGRVSCMACIFGNNDQWATVRKLDPERFEKIADYEQEFGKTIRRDISVTEAADKGTVYEGAQKNAVAITLAMSRTYSVERMRVDPCAWQLPRGAFQDCGGPT